MPSAKIPFGSLTDHLAHVTNFSRGILTGRSAQKSKDPELSKSAKFADDSEDGSDSDSSSNSDNDDNDAEGLDSFLKKIKTTLDRWSEYWDEVLAQTSPEAWQMAGPRRATIRVSALWSTGSVRDMKLDCPCFLPFGSVRFLFVTMDCFGGPTWYLLDLWYAKSFRRMVACRTQFTQLFLRPVVSLGGE